MLSKLVLTNALLKLVIFSTGKTAMQTLNLLHRACVCNDVI